MGYSRFGLVRGGHDSRDEGLLGKLIQDSVAVATGREITNNVCLTSYTASDDIWSLHINVHLYRRVGYVINSVPAGKARAGKTNPLF